MNGRQWGLATGRCIVAGDGAFVYRELNRFHWVPGGRGTKRSRHTHISLRHSSSLAYMAYVPLLACMAYIPFASHRGTPQRSPIGRVFHCLPPAYPTYCSPARRLPLLDRDTETGHEVIVSVLTQYRLLKFISINVRLVLDAGQWLTQF